MKRPESSFVLALSLSLLLHGTLALLWGDLARQRSPERPARTMLDAVLASPERQAQAQPPLSLPEEARPEPKAAAASDARHSGKGRPPGRTGDSSGNAVGQASEQLARSLLYPPEAIARGLEGETLVLLFLDEAGNAVAARVERSSGHAILDEAAVRAAKTVRSLPAGMEREVLLPVRFRLR